MSRDHTDWMLAQGKRWSFPADNKKEESVARAARFLGVEKPKPAAEKLHDLRMMLS